MHNKKTSDLEQELSACADLKKYLDQNTFRAESHTVSQQLVELMEQKGIARSQLITRSGLNDIYVHQILSGHRRPSRDKLLCLALGLELDAEQVQSLLKGCGYAPLYAKNRRDSIVLHGFLHTESLFHINENLYNLGEPLLA